MTSATKDQIMRTFRQLQANRDKIASQIATKEELAQREKDKAIVTTASTYTIKQVVTELADVQLNFGETVDSLSDKLESETDRLEGVQRAIEVETKRLQELRNIRIVADAIDILTQEHEEKLKAMEAQSTEQTEALDREIAEQRTAWEKEQADHERAMAEYNEQLQKSRTLAEEEHKYSLARERTIKADEYEHKKRNVERELADTEAEKQKDWTARETILDEKATEIKELRTKVEAFPDELNEAKQKAREDAIKAANADAKVEADLFEKEATATRNVFELKIESLNKTIEEQTKQIDNLKEELRLVQQQSQDLAAKAVSGTGEKGA